MRLKPATYPAAVVRGDDWSFPFRVKVGDAVQTLQAATIQIRTSVDATDPLVTLSLEEGITAGEDGWYWAAMTPEQTAELTDGVYDLEVQTEAGEVLTLVGGPVPVTKDVTRG